jgi:hypothetical protein
VNRLRAAVVSMLVIVSVTGCGSDEGSTDKPSDAQQITAVAKQFETALRSGDWQRACDSLSRRANREVASAAGPLGAKGSGCAAAFAAIDKVPRSDLRRLDPDKVRVADIKIHGDRATANVTPRVDNSDPAARFAREGGDWKVDTDPPDKSSG